MTPTPAASSIAGSVLPIGRAEELIGTLQSVVSARIVAGDHGAVDAVHVLVTGELTPKLTLRRQEIATNFAAEIEAMYSTRQDG